MIPEANDESTNEIVDQIDKMLEYMVTKGYSYEEACGELLGLLDNIYKCWDKEY